MDLTEAVFRSRQTLFKVLEDRNYDTSQYNKLGIDEIKVFTTVDYPNHYAGLDMVLPRKDDPTKKVRVIYTDQGKVTQYQRILNTISKLEGIDPVNEELIYMIQDPVNERVHSLVASYLWFKEALKVSFFCIYEIVVNPLEHELVPRHEKVPAEEVPALMKRLHITDRNQLPFIRFHTDPIARLIGLMPGDMVKITRPSPSSGEYIIYRTCMP